MSCELIYMFFNRIESLPYLQNQGIRLSNKYDIKVDVDGFGYCTNIYISEKEDIYENIYSNVIKNINVLVGINGMGKTTLLNIVGSTRNERKSKLSQWVFFCIYKVDDYFVIEGNDKDFIKEAVDNFEHPHGIHPEYSIKCSYNFDKQRFCFENLCFEMDKESSINKILYYKDRSNHLVGWSNKNNRYDDATDYNVFVERQIISPSPLNICKYINSINSDKNWGDFRLPHISLVLSIDGMSRKNYRWNGYDVGFEKKTFIVQFLLAYASDNYYDLDDNNLGALRELEIQLDKKSYDNGLEYKDIDNYINLILLKYDKDIHKELLEFIDILLNLDDSYFLLTSSHWQLTKANIKSGCIGLRFDVTDMMYKYLLECADKIIGINNTLKVTYPHMSAGELKMIDIFASIASYSVGKGNHYIVLLDEPEKSLHPEMSRCFIENLKRYAIMLSKEVNCTFQFIISTHTPFLISDVPKPYIHCLKRNTMGEIIIENAGMGLLSNIHDIMKDTFFLEKPFGEFSNEYFNSVVEQIKGLEEGNKKRVRKIIDDIDEPTIYTYLNKKYNERINEISTNDELILYYEEQIAKLKEKK